MFKRLISNLPFQPSLLSDVVFYTNRLKKEQALRRFGLILVIVGVILQLVVVAFPPQSSLATNTSDIIYGASSKKDVLSAYRNNQDQLGRTDIRAIFNYYGIGEAQLENASSTTVKDSDGSYINTSRSTTKFADTFIPIDGAIDGGIYEFPLSYWRKSEYPNGYPAITGVSTYGFRFWVLLKGCGNIVIEKGAKKPNIELTKKLVSANEISEGSIASYQINFRNTGSIAAQNFKLTDYIPTGFTYESHSSTVDLKTSKTRSTTTWKLDNKSGDLAPSSKWHMVTLNLKATSSSSSQKCNRVSATASNSTKVEATDSGCVTVAKATCPGTGLPIPNGGLSECAVQCPDGSTVPYNDSCSTPQLSCADLDISSTNLWNKKVFVTTITSQSGAKVREVKYYVDGSSVGSSSDANNGYRFEYTFDKEDKYKIRSKIVAETGDVQDSQSCSKTQSIVEPDSGSAILVTDKFVRNDTQNIADANNTTARPGDKLTYTLTITNQGLAPAKDLALKGEYAEDVRDILEYADIININDGKLNKSTDKITWPEVTINPGETVTKTFTVQVKNPLPATPISESNPLSYDYEMHNKYGRLVVVKLPKPASKSIEQTVSTLPNTGPSSTIMATIFLVMVVSYFYYRNRLMVKELRIIQREFQTGGM
jgi:uncharacterized repeat protein (TIGR01451 family)